MVPLPPGFNVLWDHLWQGPAASARVTLFHATRAFPRDLGRLALRHHLRYSRAWWLRYYLLRTRVAGTRPVLRNLARVLRHVYKMGLRMQRIWDHQVEPVLSEGSPRGTRQ